MMNTEHHAEAILRAAEPAAWLYRNSEGHACVQFVQGLMGDGWTEEPLYTAEAILAAVREAMEAKWQSIETAPTMKTILLWRDTSSEGFSNWDMATGHKSSDGSLYWQNKAIPPWDPQPTHWLPLPTPPRGE